MLPALAAMVLPVQAVHEVWLVALLKKPGSQSVHSACAASDAYLPAGHSVHCICASMGWKKPGSQLVQFVLDGCM